MSHHLTTLWRVPLQDCTAGNQCNGAATDAYFGKIVCSGMAKETAAPYRSADKDTCTVSTHTHTRFITPDAMVHTWPGH